MTNPANLKKSILDYAIRGELSAKFRTEFTNLSAYDEIAEFNAKISTLKSQREKLLSNLEMSLRGAVKQRRSNPANGEAVLKNKDNGNSLDCFVSSDTRNDSKDKITQLKRIISKLKTKINSYKTITPLNTAPNFNPPFEIPNSWAWVKLGDLGNFKKGPFGSSLTKSIFVPRSSNSIKVYEQKNAIQKNENLGDYFIAKQYFENNMKGFAVKGGDIIVSCAGTIGEIYKLPQNSEIGIINQALMRIRLNSLSIYDFFKLIFDFSITENSNASKGTAIKNIPPFDILKNLPIPLPPKAEQIYISQVLQNLLKECESYEAKALNLANLQTKFKTQIPKSILDYAVRGELSAKFRTEFTNLSAYDEINEFNAKISTLKSQREKLLSNLEKLLKTKPKNSDKIKHIIAKLKTKIKSYRTITPLNTAPNFNPPFEIPNSWAWVKLGEIGNIVSARRVHKSDWHSSGIPFYRAREIAILADVGMVDNELFISQKLFDELSQSGIPKVGDLMITAVGTLGKTYIVQKNDKFYYKDASVICFENISKVNSEYLKLVISSSFFQEQIKEYSVGTTVGTITIQNANKFSIPLPPKNEQEFIASELEKLLSLCKNL